MATPTGRETSRVRVRVRATATSVDSPSLSLLSLLVLEVGRPIRTNCDMLFICGVFFYKTLRKSVCMSKLCIIDLQVLSDAIFFGLGNLGLNIVAMSYEMSLCFGSTQPEPATDVRRTDRASKHA